MASDDHQLRDEIRMLGDELGVVLREQAGDAAFDLVEDARSLAKQRRAGDRDAESRLIERIAGLDLPTMSSLIHALSVFFDLANLAEDRHRVRVLRERSKRNTPLHESIPELIEQLRAANVDRETIQQTLHQSCVELVFTAHPTEAKRRSIREKVRDLRSHLAELDDPLLTPGEQQRVRRRIRADLTGLWQTDFVRFRRPSVLEELDRSLFFAGNLWHITPRVYRDLHESLATLDTDLAGDVPALLRFGTWIGGDRDGNPYVTADVTRQALRTLRREAIGRHIAQARLTRRALSMSTRKVGVDVAVREAIDDAVRRWPALAEAIDHLSDAEPYRRWLSVVQWRLERAGGADLAAAVPDGAYTDGAALVDDLRLMRRSLEQHGGALVAEAHLDDWICQAKVFGLHMMRLDVRQESSWYHDVMAELLARLGVCDDYGDLDEAQRQRVLSESMPCREPIDADDLSDNAREALDLFTLLARVVSMSGPDGLGAHVISMTHQPSDVLVVLWLSQWAAAQHSLAADRLPMPIAPLFETIDDLQRAPDVIDAMLNHSAYAEHVRSLGGEQVVMVGYSDSTKDGGYLAACWGLHEAQLSIHEAAAQHGVRVRFFHGRGGALGRGGGPAARSIHALPPHTVEIGLRVTEQGEVLAERYDDAEIAHRHLEQVTSATLHQVWQSIGRRGPVDRDRDDVVLTELSDHARRAYRELVEQPGFITYFEQATPITQIEQLPIGSRPSRRKQERSLETLRAIPWVFSWTQNRHILPAWYGLGTAIEQYMTDDDRRERLRDLYARSSFFGATIDNAALALAKTDIGIAQHHASLVEDDATRQRIWSMIESEYERSRRAVLAIVDQPQLLADVPWLKRSIEVRNPYVDPLNLIQVELFRRLRAAPAESAEAERLAELIRLSIQGIAGGLRTTG